MTSKSFLLILFVHFLANSLIGQDLSMQIEKHKSLNKKGIYVLGTWSSLNLATGIYGNVTTQEERVKSFHQMNWMWNSVNFVLASSSILSLKKYDEISSMAQLQERSKKMQRIFLINTGLDIVYISAGTMMAAYSNRFDKPDQWKGYGQSVALQGAFLFLFDGSMVLLNRKAEKRSLSQTAFQLKAMPNGLRLVF